VSVGERRQQPYPGITGEWVVRADQRGQDRGERDEHEDGERPDRDLVPAQRAQREFHA
jgi:hypothetical protein